MKLVLYLRRAVRACLMSNPLRPMSTGELLDRTFALYRKYFVLFVGISAVTHAAYLVYELLTMRAAPFRRTMGFAASYYSSLFLSWIFLMVVLTVSQAATVKAVAAVHLDQTTSVWASYRNLRGRLVSIFGVLMFVFLIAGLITGAVGVILIVAMGMLFVAFGGGPPRSRPATIAMGLSFVALGFATFVAVYARYALAVQACVVENLKAWASMKRSAALSKGGRWRIAAIYGMLVIFSWILSTSFTWAARMVALPWHSWIFSTILIDFAAFLNGSLTGPLATIGISLVYYDERVRKEAFDLHLMLTSLDNSVESQVTPVTV